jgi:hypothetical protein
MPNNIIFLDFDGPVLPPKQMIAKHLAKSSDCKFYGLTAEFIETAEKYHKVPDPISVILISQLALETNSKIVISSTWRHCSYEDFCEKFKKLGFDPDLLHKDWRTTVSGGKRRATEIQEWLDRNPDTDVFVTIDDELLDFDSHIQVCPINGFLLDNYSQAYEILTGEPSKIQPSLYSQATVDFYGPDRILEEYPIIKKSMERFKQRRVYLKNRFE